MKRMILITFILGIGLLLLVLIYSLQKPVKMIKYTDGAVVEVNPEKNNGKH